MACHECSKAREGCCGHYDCESHRNSSDLTLHMPCFKRRPFEGAVIEQYYPREPDALASARPSCKQQHQQRSRLESQRLLEDIPEELWENEISPATISVPNK